MQKHRRLRDAYCFPGFRPASTVVGIFGDPKARVIRLHRREKKRCAGLVDLFTALGTTERFAGFETCPAEYADLLGLEIRRVDCRRCGKVKQETLDWLTAGNPFYTKRFAFFVGRRCRSMTVKDVAEETCLSWWTIRDLEMEYMREQLRRAGKPAP